MSPTPGRHALAKHHPPHPRHGPFDALTRQNLTAESLFSAFNGVYMALAILAAPVVAVVGLRAGPLELTILVAAFPVGVFFGPLWAGLGRRIGMRRLVLLMAAGANLPLFALLWVDQSWLFTLLVGISQVMNSAMRMGQSSLYHALYPQSVRGRVLGRLTFWTFLTMVPTILAAGWLLDKSHEMYRLLYPVAGLCGLVGCLFYARLRLPDGVPETVPDRPDQRRRALAAAAKVFERDPAFRFFQAAFFLSGSAFFMSTHVILLLVSETFRWRAFDLALWMSVVPQLLLALSSPAWGPVLDRIGIVRCRLLVAGVMTSYLACYWLGLAFELPLLVCVGSVLQGVSNGGGQLTWSLASSHFAPSTEEVPLYNGIHFVLNGVRGLLLPWVGSVLWVLVGPWAVLAALVTSLGSVPLIVHSLRYEPLRPPADGG
jgi:MFS family permease